MRVPTAARTLVRALSLSLLTAMPAHATLGIFEQGNGIVSMGMGGVSYGYGQETTALAANPAHALNLGSRFDVGIDVFTPIANARYRGNALGPDERYRTDSKRYYAIPQGGFARPLGERWAWGMTLLNAGLGPDYDRSPYARFPGAASRVSLALGTSSLVTAFAYRPATGHSLGLSLNAGYQQLRIKGLGFLTAPDGPGRVSETPGRVTDQGRDGAFTAGFSLGWHGQISPQLALGAGYRSKTYTQKHREYRGLLPDRGALELPAIWGAGFAVNPLPDWTLAFDYQRYENGGEKGFGNSIGRLSEGNLLGTANGPGFGFDDMNAYKVGLAWHVAPGLTLRGGYIHATQMVQPQETLFGLLGSVTLTTHYSLGATWRRGPWEISGFAAHAPDRNVAGEGSVAPGFGGGEADIGNEVVMAGISFGRRFGK